jgi:hypothetical protein
MAGIQRNLFNQLGVTVEQIAEADRWRVSQHLHREAKQAPRLRQLSSTVIQNIKCIRINTFRPATPGFEGME